MSSFLASEQGDQWVFFTDDNDEEEADGLPVEGGKTSDSIFKVAQDPLGHLRYGLTDMPPWCCQQ